jgi:uncharacterized membrane protein YphA (DoxX/SURF4 family)
VVVPDQPLSGTERLAGRIRREMLQRFGIDHPVLQFETADCGQGTLLCEISCTGSGVCTPRASSVDDPAAAADSPGRVQPLVFHALRLLMGAVFLYASYDKILHPQSFAQAIYNYQILPDGLVNLAALVLPWLELLLGLCLVAGVWLPGATVTSSGLLTLFLAALVFNQIRGLDIHCGCFSTEASAGPADLWTVARDLGFLAAALYLTVYVFFVKPVPTKATPKEAGG